MKKLFVPKLSILGLVILGASAVTAALASNTSASNNGKQDYDGRVQPSTSGSGEFTCVPTDTDKNCFTTVNNLINSGTTNPGTGIKDTSAQTTLPDPS